MLAEHTTQMLPEWIKTEDNHMFQLPPRTSRALAQKGYKEIMQESIPAARVFNQGQFGDVVGSTYEYLGLRIVTTNRHGPLDQDSSAAVVKKEIQVPMITLIDEKGNIIKLLVPSQVVLRENNLPINNFFKPEEILSPEQLEVYNKYHGQKGMIDIKTRMILSQAEGDLARFHKARCQ